MIISLVVAMDEQRGIGIDGGLPWHLPNDLKNFKSITMSHHIIMGRKTYESIGRPLPGRIMIVITRNHDYEAEGCLIVHSLDGAIKLARENGENEAFIIGGGEIFSEAIDLADRIYLTQVHTAAEVDVYFPDIDPDEWLETETEAHQADQKHQFSYTFKTLIRKNGSGNVLG